MPQVDGPPYRSLFIAALFTAAVSLVAFGLTHAAFITWAADRSEDPSLLARLGLMFSAPAAFGIPFALISASLGALAWRATRGSRLATWRYGLVLATALVPPVVMSLIKGPYGDASPDGVTLFLTMTSLVLLPALLGVWLAREPVGALAGLAALPLAGPWTMFIAAEGLIGWVIPFVVSLFVILGASGWLMARFLAQGARASVATPEVAPDTD